MPLVRYQIRNEYGLSDPHLYAAADKDDPEALLEGVAMAALVGLLRQLGDLSEFAAEIFHDLHEDVMATASRGHGLMLRLHQLEAEFPSVEKALISQINLPNVTENEGIQWHTNVQIDQNLITRGDMPRFIMDSYEECHGPPRLFTLDKFDVAGAGACLKRYSDPSFFKTELASSCSIETEDTPREKKPRKIKKKATRWKKGETLESLLISSSESPPSSENQSSGKALISRVVKLKSQRNLHNSDNNSRKIYHGELLELVESQQKIILEDSKRQSSIKAESNGTSKQAAVQFSFETENEPQKMHKVYPIQEQNEASSESEKIEIGIETSSSQAREKTMTDSDVTSEHENFVDALNTIELEMETDGENKSKSDSISSFQKEMVHGNLVSDTIGELVSTNQDLELNGNTEIGKATEEFFDNDDLMDVSSTSSLHSDGVHQIGQLSISYGDKLMDELKVPDEARLDDEDVVCSTSQTDNHQEQTNLHLNNMDVPTNSSPEMPEVSEAILKTQESKLLEETHILEDSLDSHGGNGLLINNRSSSDSDEPEEPLGNPIEVSQVELRNISEEILNLEEYLISTRKDESITQEIFSHDHPQETAQDFAEEKFDDPNAKLQHEQSEKAEDDLSGEGSLLPDRVDEIAPGSTVFLPTEDATDLSTHMTGLDLEDDLHEIRIQSSEDPTTITSDDYLDNSRSISIHEREASSIGPQSPINVLEETTFQGSYPRYHMDNFIEPDEVLLDLGETKEETYRNESPHHFEVDTHTNQFNKSEDWQQYQNKDESRIILINREPTDESLHENCEENSCSKSHEPSINDDDSIELCAENLSSRNIVGADGMCTNKSAPFSPKEECEMWAGHFEPGAKEKSPSPADVLWEPTGSPCERRFQPADTLLHYEVGGHEVSEQDLEMDACDANKVDNACEETLSVKEDGFGHNDVGDTSVGVNELLEEDLETKSQDFFDKGKVDNELPVETSEFNEETIAVSGASIKIAVKNEVFVEALESNENDGAEDGPSTSSMVNDEVIVGTSELNEESNTVVVPIPFSVIEASNISQESSAAGGVPSSSVMDNEALVETLELNEEANVEDHVQIPVAVKNKVLIEAVKPNEKDSSEVESSELNEETNAEGGVPIASAVENEVLVEALEITEKGAAEGGRLTSFVVNNEVPVETLGLNKEDDTEDLLPMPSVDHVHELLENKENKMENEVFGESINEKEEENAVAGASTPSMVYVHEILQEPTNLNLYDPDTDPSSKYEECLLENAGNADLDLPAEGGNISQSCTISLDNPLYDESLSENLSEGSSELHSNKQVPCNNLQKDQEKSQEDMNQIGTELWHNDSTIDPCTVDPNKTILTESCFPFSSISQVQKDSEENFDLKSDNMLSGDKSVDSNEVLASTALANVSLQPEASELTMCSTWSLVSEHKPPPLPPLGWRVGGKLLKGTSLPSNEHSSKLVDDTKLNLSVHMRGAEAPPVANHDDTQASEGGKPQFMSLSDLPPISFEYQPGNPNSTLLPSSGGNLQNTEYNNGSSAAVGFVGPQMRPPQYAWPDAQHQLLPVPAWTTGPGLVQVHQPGYLISLEDNLWAQYGVGPSIEDERLGRKHCSIRNIPRNPLMDAVAAHDRSTMRKVSEMVKPDDKLKADERNSLLEQIRNKSFTLRPVGAPKTTAVKAPQTNLKVAAIVEKANAIRQAFVGSDEEDGDSWSDA